MRYQKPKKRYNKIALTMDEIAKLLGTTPRYARVLLNKHNTLEPTSNVTRLRRLIELMSERGQL